MSVKINIDKIIYNAPPYDHILASIFCLQAECLTTGFKSLDFQIN